MFEEIQGNAAKSFLAVVKQFCPRFFTRNDCIKKIQKMNNVGLEVVFWTILSVYLLAKFGGFLKK